MEVRVIKSPSKGTMDILKQRMRMNQNDELDNIGAVGLVQGKLIDMVYVADLAEKAVGVTVKDVRGNCPQHMIMLAIFGDTSSVESAISKIKDGKY